MTVMGELRVAFIEAATWHGSLAHAEELLHAHPELRQSDIHTAAILGDDTAVRQFIAQDPKHVTAKSPPHGGDALNYLGLSKYLRLDPTRSDAFLRAATALLDAGAARIPASGPPASTLSTRRRSTGRPVSRITRL